MRKLGRTGKNWEETIMGMSFNQGISFVDLLMK